MKNKLLVTLVPSQICAISNKDLDNDFMEILNETTKKVGKDKPTKERL